MRRPCLRAGVMGVISSKIRVFATRENPNFDLYATCRCCVNIVNCLKINTMESIHLNIN
jgi:hypothetical protein